MQPPTLAAPCLFGWAVRSAGFNEPSVMSSPDASTAAGAPIRIAEPVVQQAGGGLIRATPTSSSLYGFAFNGLTNPLPSSIAVAPKTRYLGQANNPYVSQFYTADPSQNVFTGRIVGTTSLALIGQQHDLAYAVSAGPTPTVTPEGTTGATSYTYKVTAVTQAGESLVGTGGSTTSGNATLSSTNYNQIAVTALDDETFVLAYNLYRTEGGGRQGLVGSYSGQLGANTWTFKDVGIVATITNPSVNSSGWLINDGASSENVVQIIGLSSLDPVGTLHGRVEFFVPVSASQYLSVGGN